MRAVALLLEQRQQRRERRAHVADDAEIDRRAATDVLRPEIDLRDADTAPSRIELAIGEVGPEHQQDVAVEHRVVAGREADQPGHADVVGIVPFDMLLAAQRVHHRRLEALAERQQLVVRALASRAAQDGDAASSPLSSAARRSRSARAGVTTGGGGSSPYLGQAAHPMPAAARRRPGITTTDTPRLPTASRIAISRTRGIWLAPR